MPQAGTRVERSHGDIAHNELLRNFPRMLVGIADGDHFPLEQIQGPVRLLCNDEQLADLWADNCESNPDGWGRASQFKSLFGALTGREIDAPLSKSSLKAERFVQDKGRGGHGNEIDAEMNALARVGIESWHFGHIQ